MKRKIIRIDEAKCNGCGACANACHEGAIDMIDGKAKLMRENYCDGLGDCLPVCPTGAITFEEREAPAYDEAAVLAAKQRAKEQPVFSGCPGTMARQMKREAAGANENKPKCEVEETNPKLQSRLSQWPVQIKLLPVNAPFYQGADILVAADCTAYAYGNFHEEFIKDRVTLIGCPKLDEVDYFHKLYEIIKNNEIKSITVVRMEVPCCGGFEYAVKRALQESGKTLPLEVVTISTAGEIIK